MRSRIAIVTACLLGVSCAAPTTGHGPKCVEVGIVAESGPIPSQAGDLYPRLGIANASAEPVRLEQPLLSCRVASAALANDSLGLLAIDVILDDRDAAQFEDFTGAHLGRAMAVLVDGKIVFIATIADRLPGQILIRLDFTEEENGRIIDALR